MEKNQHQAHPNRHRPSMLRALGRNDPPAAIMVDGQEFRLVEKFKHDAWAATSLYECSGRKIVCKINRTQPIGIFPTRWLGRWLARRELAMMSALNGVKGIPRCYKVASVDGRAMTTAAAHDFVEGNPLSKSASVPVGFFDRLAKLLDELHTRRIAYVDLHKHENILVGDDGDPHLVDFQISVRLPNWFGFRSPFKMLAESDRYHLDKIARRWHIEAWHLVPLRYPWWIRLHRAVTIPIRTLRRRFLVFLRVRSGQGQAATEVGVETGLRKGG